MFTKKAGALLVALSLTALVLMGMRGVSGAHSKTAKGCPDVPALQGQRDVSVFIDGTNSTRAGAIRSAYEKAAATVVTEAVGEGAYLDVSVFGGSITALRTVCETSTKTSAAAPLFAAADQSGLTKTLDRVLASGSRTRAEGGGSDIYGAVVDAVERQDTLGARRNGGRIYMLTDGDQVTAGVSMHLFLHDLSDERIAARIVGNQPVPDARGIAIEIHGIGRGTGESFTTVEARRMTHIWTLVCEATHARSCHVSTDLN